MTTALRWTSADLEIFSENGKRYEIIDGELYVSKQPHWHHQNICARITTLLTTWSDIADAGVVTVAPGVIFADDEDVAPDIAWISHARLANAQTEDGKFHIAPELVVEVLSFGTANERRDREVKVRLYSRRGVQEYWIVDWRSRQVEVYRRENAALTLIATLFETDHLTSPLLPGFDSPVKTIFKDIRAGS